MFARYVRTLSRRVTFAVMPTLTRGASDSVTGKRTRSGSRWSKRREDRSRLEVLSRLYGSRLDDAGDGRPHDGVPEVELGDAQQLLGRVGVRLRAGDARLVLLDLLSGHEPRMGRHGSLPARELRLGRLVGRLRLGERRPRLVDGDLKALHLDEDERVALLDGLSLDERNAVHRPGDARRDLHLLKGVDASGRHHVVLNLARLERRNLNRVLQLVRGLRSLERVRVRLGAAGGAAKHQGRREHEHEIDGGCPGERRLHLSSAPRGSSPSAWRRLR